MEYFQNDTYDPSNLNVGLLVCSKCGLTLIEHGHRKECIQRENNVRQLTIPERVEPLEPVPTAHTAEIKKLKTEFKGTLSPAALLRELADDVESDPDHFATILVIAVTGDGSDYDWSSAGPIKVLPAIGALEMAKQDLMLMTEEDANE
jgi:hypothetical protein